MAKAKKETKKNEKKPAKAKKETKTAKPKAEKAVKTAKPKSEKLGKEDKEKLSALVKSVQPKPAETKTKLVIFDFWGTLVENGVFPSPIRQSYRLLRIRSTFPEYIVPFEETLMLRKYKDLYEAFTYVFDRLRVRPPRFVMENLVGLWNKNKLLAKPYPETIQVLEELKAAGCKMALISNTDCFTLKEVMEKYGLDRYFEVISLSYEKGMLKSNPLMFKEILDKLGVDESETIMVGDSVESDIAAAEKAGIRGILIDRRERREFSPKIKSLLELKDFL